MITVKQILEQYDIVTDKASSHDLYLSELASSGIIEETKIPMLRRSLNKNINEMTVAEKKSLVSLIECLMSNVMLENNGGKAYPSDKDMPTVIILKRKAIRVFPDNQKIGLYYSQALDRYISIPFGSNVKDLSPQLNEENINEISQELATRAYSKRMAKIKDIEDSKEEPEKKAIEIQRQKGKLKQLSHRMMTTATDPTGKNIRPWAGREAVKTGIEAGKIRISASKEKAPEESRVKRYLKASPSERKQIDLSGKTPSTSEISKETGANPFDVLAAKAGAKFGDVLTGRAKTPAKTITVKEAFKEKLKLVRQKKQIDEVSWDDVKSGAKKAAQFAGDITGVSDDVASAVGKAKEGDYSGAAWDAAKGVGKGILTVGTGGAASAGIRGAIAGARALKAGRGVAAAARTAKRSAITSKGGRLAKGIARGAGKIAAGVAGIAGSTISGLADGLKTEPSKTEYSFGSIKPQIAGSPEALQTHAKRTNIAYGTPAGAYMGYQAQQNESTFSTLKQIVENNISSHQLQIGEETISINKSIAKKIIKLHESLNKSNKKKLERMLNEDVVSFRKVLNFALK